MKTIYFTAFLFAALHTKAQQIPASNSSAIPNTLRMDESVISVTKYDANNRVAPLEKPVLITAQDKRLWTRPVYDNPNYHKAMPIKDPNVIEPEDKE